MENLLRLLEKLIPKKIYKFGQPTYHWLIAVVGAILYGFPAVKMTTLGVTGTKGKTSTANFIYTVLHESGKKVGLVSTANIKIGEKEMVNKYHMSMPGRFILQKLLRDMRKAGCEYVVLEVTSEGIKQFRHLGLFLNVAIFTNLSPEHLASHGGSFAKYRATKMRIFKRSFIRPLELVILNRDDENYIYFEKIAKNKKVREILYSLTEVKNIEENNSGVSFNFKEENYKLNILGRFNIYNALPAILLRQEYGVTKSKIKEGLKALQLIPGRMEEIKEGQDFQVIVDYAHEKLSMNSLLDTAQQLKTKKENKIILVLGGDGGGRDEQRLYDMGEVAGKKADLVIVSNSDPYFDDQHTLAKKIASQAEKQGKVFERDLFIILDRGQAIEKAISLAKSGDVVLLTTRGSLTTMSVQGKKLKSDDRVLARLALQKRKV